MWGAINNTGYNGMPTSLGLVWMLIHWLGQGSMADKPRTSQCPSVSVADITYRHQSHFLSIYIFTMRHIF